jgi:hypothetical protein
MFYLNKSSFISSTEIYISRQLTYIVLAKVDSLFSPSYTLDFCLPPYYPRFKVLWFDPDMPDCGRPSRINSGLILANSLAGVVTEP